MLAEGEKTKKDLVTRSKDRVEQYMLHPAVGACLHEGRPSQLNTAKVSLRNLTAAFQNI